MQLFFCNEYENELIPAVEGKYSTFAKSTDLAGIVASREHRAFGGFSLGAVTTWYIFENRFDLQKYFLPMSGDSWHIEMFGGHYEPEATAAYLAPQSSRTIFTCGTPWAHRTSAFTRRTTRPSPAKNSPNSR